MEKKAANNLQNHKGHNDSLQTRFDPPLSAFAQFYIYIHMFNILDIMLVELKPVVNV